MKNCVFLPYETIDFASVEPTYQKLRMLRKALGFRKSQELNESQMLEEVSKHNLNEFYLMEYLINAIRFAPADVITQNMILLSLYDDPKAFSQQYEITKLRYKNELQFKRFANEIYRALDLSQKNSCIFANYIIFELCADFINKDIRLEQKDVYLSFHLLLKWIYEQRDNTLADFTDVEKIIIYNLAHGSSPNELMEDEAVLERENDVNFINTIIHDIIPAKCNTNSITKAMAAIYVKSPNPKCLKCLSDDEFEQYKKKNN